MAGGLSPAAAPGMELGGRAARRWPPAVWLLLGPPSLVLTLLFVLPIGLMLVTSVTDPLGRRATFSYDGNGDLVTRTVLAGTPAAATTTFAYDPRYDTLTSARRHHEQHRDEAGQRHDALPGGFVGSHC